MKLDQARRTIEAYANGIDAVNAPSVSVSLRSIASFLGSNEQMSTLIRRGSKLALGATPKTRRHENFPCVEAAVHLDFLAKVLVSGEAKKEVVKDLVGLSKLLRAFAESETLSAALEKLRDAMKPEPVEQQIEGFVNRLKKETGTPSFDRTFTELATSQLKREHVVAVAKSVYGAIKKDTSRKAALEYIRKPHDAYTSAKRGIDATGGRSAA